MAAVESFRRRWDLAETDLVSVVHEEIAGERRCRVGAGSLSGEDDGVLAVRRVG